MSGSTNKFLKQWGKRKLSEIDSGEVVDLHARVGEKNGHYAANRMLALLRAMFNFAMSPTGSIKWKGTNPTAGIRKFRKSREIVTSSLRKCRRSSKHYRKRMILFGITSGWPF